MRRLALVFAVLAAACSGAADEPIPDSTTTTAVPIPATTTVTASLQAATTTSIAPAPATTDTPRPVVTTKPEDSGGEIGRRSDWFVVWVTGWLPDGFTDSLRNVQGMNLVSEVWVGNAEVTRVWDAAGDLVNETAPGFVIPIELQAINASHHSTFVPPDVAASLSSLAEDEVLLGEASARFRGADVGATFRLEGGEVLTVAGVVPDRWVGFAEMVTTASGFVALGADRPRYAVVNYTGGKARLVEAATALTKRGVRVWRESEVDVFRHADAVRPQIEIKERFGEFSYRPRAGGRIQVDPAWVSDNIVTMRLPLIGIVRCHRDFAELLGKAMEQIAASTRPQVITPTSNRGCFSARFISGRRDLSRHAWGIAIDMNWGNDFDSVRSPVAPELLAATSDVGLTSGHDWVNPDAGHFEWIGPDP